MTTDNPGKPAVQPEKNRKTLITLFVILGAWFVILIGAGIWGLPKLIHYLNEKQFEQEFEQIANSSEYIEKDMHNQYDDDEISVLEVAQEEYTEEDIAEALNDIETTAQITEIQIVPDPQEQTVTSAEEEAIGEVNIENVLLSDRDRVREEVISDPVDDGEQPMSISMVEQKPSFPGGEAEMYRWISANLVYPPAAAEEGVSGRVVVEFVVGKDGSISNARVVRGRHPALDREALRLIQSMPRWIPGRNNGRVVKVTYTLPVTFRLQ